MIKLHVILVSTAIFATSSLAFAQDKGTSSTASPTGTSMTKPTHAEHEAAEDSIKADAKAAEARCKKLNSTERESCEKEAEAKEKAAKADMKAKHK